jgi:peptidoglycan-N-acetylglucosamine deacetylase
MTFQVRSLAVGLVSAAFVLSSARTALMQQVQVQQAPLPPGPELRQSEEQLRQTMSIVRVGRNLTPKSWPNGAKVAVNIGYDVDNMGISRGAPLPVAASGGEYGAVDGLPRILALLEKHQLPATFYMPASSAILNPEMIPLIQKSGRHEITPHGWVHEGAAAINSVAEEERLLTQSLDYFQKVLGKRPIGFRAPGWGQSPHSIEALKKSGILYDSSMMGMDTAYELIANGQPTGIVELPVEWILDDAPYFGESSSLPSPELIFKVYKDEFDVAYQEGTLCMLTFHPHVSGRRSRIAEMDKLFQYIKSKPNVWIATAAEIATYVKQNAGKTN